MFIFFPPRFVKWPFAFEVLPVRMMSRNLVFELCDFCSSALAFWWGGLVLKVVMPLMANLAPFSSHLLEARKVQGLKSWGFRDHSAYSIWDVKPQDSGTWTRREAHSAEGISALSNANYYSGESSGKYKGQRHGS